MKFMNLGVTAFILRLYFMMAIVICAGFSGYWIVSILALPVFFSAMMGIKIGHPTWQIRSHKTKSSDLQHAH